MTDVELKAIDGGNPLGFLAGLGVLNLLTLRACRLREEGLETKAPRLRWQLHGQWQAVLSDVDLELEQEGETSGLCTALLEEIARFGEGDEWGGALGLAYAKEKPERMRPADSKAARDLKAKPQVIREYHQQLMASCAGAIGRLPVKVARREIDVAAAFVTEVAIDNNGNAKPTGFHFTAGNQSFLKMVEELRRVVGVDEMRKGLLGPWISNDAAPSLMWNATVSREYALRAKNPSNDKKGSVAGANLLAVFGVPAFPLALRGTSVRTPCIQGGWKDSRFAWPLWADGLSWCTAKALAATTNWHTASLAQRRARRVMEVMETNIHRADQGGYGSFAPARPTLV